MESYELLEYAIPSKSLRAAIARTPDCELGELQIASLIYQNPTISIDKKIELLRHYSACYDSVHFAVWAMDGLQRHFSSFDIEETTLTIYEYDKCRTIGVGRPYTMKHELYEKKRGMDILDIALMRSRHPGHHRVSFKSKYREGYVCGTFIRGILFDIYSDVKDYKVPDLEELHFSFPEVFLPGDPVLLLTDPCNIVCIPAVSEVLKDPTYYEDKVNTKEDEWGKPYEDCTVNVELVGDVNVTLLELLK